MPGEFIAINPHVKKEEEAGRGTPVITATPAGMDQGSGQPRGEKVNKIPSQPINWAGMVAVICHPSYTGGHR
jgi:hypothetical protein